MLPDYVMFLMTATALVSSLYYAFKKHSWIVGSWSIPLFWITLFYLVLTLNIEPINSNMDIRLSVFRPAQFFFYLGVIVYLANGRFNQMIDSAVEKVKSVWNNISSRL